MADTPTPSAHTGLSAAEASQRLARFGPNALNTEPPRTLASRLLDMAREPMFMLLVLAALVYASADGFDEVVSIVQGRCSMCHAAEPVWEGMYWPPKNVVLETPAQIAHEARRIAMQSGYSHAMPPANLSYMEPEERAKIVEWFRAAGAGGVEG